jgi:hypothetical protein
MKDLYDFSNGVRGKYAGKVNTADIRILGSAKPAESARGPNDHRRDFDGEISQKRGDTLVGTLRKTYGPGFAPGVRGDTRLDTLRKRARGESLSKFLKVK